MIVFDEVHFDAAAVCDDDCVGAKQFSIPSNHQVFWLGTENENPKNDPLQIPDTVRKWTRNEGEEGSGAPSAVDRYRFGCSDRAAKDQVVSAAEAASVRRRAIRRVVDMASDDEGEGEIEIDEIEIDADESAEAEAEDRRVSGRKRKAISYGGLDDDGDYTVRFSVNICVCLFITEQVVLVLFETSP